MEDYLVVVTTSVARTLAGLEEGERVSVARCLSGELGEAAERPRGLIARAPAGYWASPLSSGWTAIGRSLSSEEIATMAGSGRPGPKTGYLLVDLLGPTALT